MSDTVINYSDAFPDALTAQGKGSNFLALYRLDEPTTARFDGKKAQYELVYRWLSQDCATETDQAWACVQGSEVTYWQTRELGKEFLAAVKNGTANLFEQFRLF